MAIVFVKPHEAYWHVSYNRHMITRIKEKKSVYMDENDGIFETFIEAQNFLLQVLKETHAQAVADIARLTAELTQIESKIRIINTSTEADYTE